MIHQALEGVGGVDYLMEQAREEPRAFLGLIKAVIPRQVEGKVGVSLEKLLGASFDTPETALNAPVDGRLAVDSTLYGGDIIDAPHEEKDHGGHDGGEAGSGAAEAGSESGQPAGNGSG
jgi:hypothetical protein